MPGKIRIVTDSSAQFIDPSVVTRYDITVVPLQVRLGTRAYREGIDITNESFLQQAKHSDTLPVLLPPPSEAFAEVYARLCRQTDRILSIHLSRAMHGTWQNARLATQTLLGRCEIQVVDSQSTSVGLAFLVETAARLAEETDSLDEIVRALRILIPRIYSIFSVESLEYLRRADLLSESQALLGEMLSVKPFVTIEDGELIAMEKARTRVQAADKLVEFVTEFADIEQMTVLHHTSSHSEALRQLVERLAAEIPTQTYPILVYNPSLACFIGPDAMGMMVLEGELDDLYDDKDDED